MRGKLIHYALMAVNTGLAFLMCRFGGIRCILIALAILGVATLDVVLREK